MQKRKNIEETVVVPKKKHEPLKTQGPHMLSVCIPTSIISHCKNLDQKTQCIYQVARALCIYNVGEVVVLDVSTAEKSPEKQEATVMKKKIVFGDEDNGKSTEEQAGSPSAHSDLMLIASLLQFFITPPYLVKSSFTKEQLQFFSKAAQLPKISSLPFMLNTSNGYKEGLSIPRHKTKKNLTKYINVGEAKPVEIDQEIPANVRVTVDVKNKKIVSPREAYGVVGVGAKFGYHVRLCTQFSKLFTESAISSGYTKTVYVNSGDFFLNQLAKNDGSAISTDIRVDEKDKILLVVGEFAKLQQSFKADAELAELDNFKQMCDSELKIVSGCRIEDGVLIALTHLQAC